MTRNPRAGSLARLVLTVLVAFLIINGAADLACRAGAASLCGW